MKRISIVFFAALLLTTGLNSCRPMLEVESDRYAFDENAQMKQLSDTLYAMVGVFSRMQDLADRYVLLGELRGDLMDATENATTDLKKLYTFDLTKDNPYASMNAFYAVINQCNYIIHYADTAYTQKSDKPFMRVYVAAKTIRAWTYFQLAMNFKQVPYSDQPIMSIQGTQQDFPTYTLDEMLPLLIEELLPLVDERMLNLGNFAGYNSQRAIIPVRLLLGDLYLTKGDYAQAAEMYYQYLYRANGYSLNPNYQNTWSIDNGEIMNYSRRVWGNNTYRMNSGELITALATYPLYGNTFSIDSMASREQIVASSQAVANWMGAVYYESENSTRMGDLRMMDAIDATYASLQLVPDLEVVSSRINLDNLKPLIKTFGNMNYNKTKEDEQVLAMYRIPLVYLRYAEAVNRLGYPQVAFAVLKHGMKRATLSRREVYTELITNDTIVPTYIAGFGSVIFEGNIGLRARGCGKVQDDTTYFVIDSARMVDLGYYTSMVEFTPDSVFYQLTREDTLCYVEDNIMQEAAMECAFEGTRFQDLMRVARRRNDPAYLADKVSAKYATPALQQEIRAKLLNEDNWYLPQ